MELVPPEGAPPSPERVGRSGRIEFTAEELALTFTLLGDEPPDFNRGGTGPSDDELRAAGITGGYRAEGVSYGWGTLALLALASPELNQKVDAYLAERGWDIPQVREQIDELKRAMSLEIERRRSHRETESDAPGA